jgi:GT2 family glycosyltransferase
MKTLLMCPVYNSEDTLPDWFVFIENNSTDTSVELINNWSYRHKLIRIWVKKHPSKNPYLVMAHIRQLAITYARRSGCDFAIFLDSDVFTLDEEFIELITRDDADLVGGAYMRMFADGLGVAAYFEGSKKGLYKVMKAVTKPYQYAVAVGGGCMCLSKDIISDRGLSFVPLQRGDIAEDFGYCLKASERGFAVFLNGELDMLHLDTSNRQKPWTVNKEGEYLKWSY